MTISTQWVVLELTSKADNEDPDIIRASIKHHIRDAEVFIPASVVQRGDQKVHHYLVEGYAFIRHLYPEGYYSRLIETKYVQGPLYMPTGHKKEKRLALISSEEVEKLRAQIKVEVDQGIEVDDIVVITSGPYKNILAIVREEILEQEAVVVHIQLRSTDRLITLPRAFLRLQSKPLHIAFRPHYETFSAWAEAALRLAKWSIDGLNKVHNQAQTFIRYEKWVSKIKRVCFSLEAYSTRLDLSLVLSKFCEFKKLHSGVGLRNQFLTIFSSLDWDGIIKKHQEMVLLARAYSRISTIYSDVKHMTEKLPMNLIIDGTQLFIRCTSAPGLGALTDSQGRPTGAIVGFLRSLGAYRKRFPEATVYVCWDGSSQRRKAMYSEYKGNRVARSEDSFGMIWLRETLSLLGVRQAYNSKEEADDVIASLVRGSLKDNLNIIISTDRDMFQLISEFTHQLCPTVGLSKEKLYDSSMVELEYGVPPKRMVHVRALSGDSSDNIPGVSGFGLKTAIKLIKLYGTVTALLKSNLAGLSEGQIVKLRTSEKQVVANIDLLSLKDVTFDQIESNPDQTVVAARLSELQIKADPILAAFFPR